MKRRTSALCTFLCISLLLTALLQPLSAAGSIFVLLSRGETVSVPDRISMDELNAIPVATPDMTEDELRQICVDFMLMQQSFTWTPATDLDYSCPAAGAADDEGLLHCQTGSVYAGLPYGSGGLSLYNAMLYYDPETGVFDAGATQTETTLPMSNNCATAVLWALARVCTSIKSFGGTVTMTQKNGFLPIGDYTYDADLARYDTSDETRTKKICEANGQQTMFESYALMKKADGMVVYTQNSGGHARMVKYDATVVRKSDGTINPDASYVIAIEQFSTKKARTSGGQTVYQHGEIDKKYTFSALYKSGYLPFTIAEFTGKKPVERAQVRLSSTASGLSFTSLRSKSIITNYNLAAVTLTVTGSDGTVKEQITKHLSVSKLYASYKLNELIPNNYKASGRVTIKAIVGSGETITVYEDDVCYNQKGSFYSSHLYSSAVVTPSTCTEGGYTTYTCSRCGNRAVSDQTAAKGHDLISHEGKEASCTESGWNAYHTCTRCDFSDYEEVPSFGHAWGEPEYTWSGDLKTCTARRTCTLCSEEETETANAPWTGNLAVAEFSNGSFERQQLRAFLWGDANGDDNVSNKDIVRLKNYFANYDDDTGTSSVEIFHGADANGDGVVSNKDIVRLKNYFANYDDETGTSDVTLGA